MIFRFGMVVRQYWALYRLAIEKSREEYKGPTLFEDFERLDALMADLDRQHGVGDEYLTTQQLRRIVEAESKALATEESPTQGGISASVEAHLESLPIFRAGTLLEGQDFTQKSLEDPIKTTETCEQIRNGMCGRSPD